MAVETRLQLRQLIVGRGVKELAHRHRIAVKHLQGGDLPIAKLEHVDYRYVKPLLDGGGLKSPKHDGMVAGRQDLWLHVAVIFGLEGVPALRIRSCVANRPVATVIDPAVRQGFGFANLDIDGVTVKHRRGVALP